MKIRLWGWHDEVEEIKVDSQRPKCLPTILKRDDAIPKTTMDGKHFLQTRGYQRVDPIKRE